MRNYAHWEYLLSCLPPKITACCSILCYGLCMPMGWLVEQRMGECRPDCSSKQVLHAFEDAHWLQAKWIWKSGCTCTHFTTHNQLITKMSMIIMSHDCLHIPVTIIRVTGKWRKGTDRFYLAVIVIKSLLSKYTWSIIHCLSTAGTAWIINSVLAVGRRSPSFKKVHNSLSREGRDLLWLFTNLFCSFISFLHRRGPFQEATCAPEPGDCCIFNLDIQLPEPQQSAAC